MIRDEISMAILHILSSYKSLSATQISILLDYDYNIKLSEYEVFERLCDMSKYANIGRKKRLNKATRFYMR